MLRPDLPINGTAEDLFERKNFIDTIVNELIQFENGPSMVLGITGKWGTGKSSVLNMVKDELLSRRKEFEIIEFSPWFFHGSDSLVSEFLTQFGIGLFKKKKEDVKFEKVARAAVKLAVLLRPVKYIPGMHTPYEAFNGIVSGMEKFFEREDQTVLEIKESISQTIKETKKKFLIIIDDLDRLSKNEILQVLITIRAIADFDNTFYLLAYDPDVLIKACQNFQFESGKAESGEEFVKKIIHSIWELSSFTSEQFSNYYWEKFVNFEDLNKHFDSLDFFEKERFLQFVNNDLIRLFKTPRDVNVLMNNLTLPLRIISEKVDFTDLVALTAIQSFSYSVYKFIAENKDIFVGEPLNWIIDEKEREKYKAQVAEEIRGLLEGKSSEDKKIIMSMLLKMFPKLRQYFDDHFYHQREEAEELMRQHWRIGVRECFDTYFTYLIPSNQIGKIEIRKFIENARDISMLNKGYEEFKKRNLEGRLVINLLDLSKSTGENLELEVIKNISKLLIGKAFEIEVPGYVLTKGTSFVADVIGSFVQAIGEKERVQLLEFLIAEIEKNEDSKTLSQIATLTYVLLFVEQQGLLRKEQLDKFKQKLVKNYELRVVAEQSVNSENILPILYYWQYWDKDSEHLKAFLEIVRRCNEYMLRFIDSTMRKSVSTAYSGVRCEVNEEALKDFDFLEIVKAETKKLLKLVDDRCIDLRHRDEIEEYLRNL